MNLDRVTITGADDSVRPSDLLGLSVKHPFVEWGILVHAKGAGPRFPSVPWIDELRKLQESLRPRDDEGDPMKLSLHVCGRWVRDLLIGVDSLPKEMERCFDRIQLNFHAENTPCNPLLFAKLLGGYELHQIIFQIDGANGNAHFETVCRDENLDAVPLFDISGGAGVLPENWPKPSAAYSGYAGGLGPDNLAEQIPLIGAAAGDARIWIDMETRVRSDGDRQFDLAKVERCLQIAAPFINRS